MIMTEAKMIKCSLWKFSFYITMFSDIFRFILKKIIMFSSNYDILSLNA